MEQHQAKRKAPSGQGLVEYALILVLVALIAIPVVYLIGLGHCRQKKCPISGKIG
jgi:hypothetical protein